MDKEEKQVLPMSLILTADEIAEEFLFKDGIRLDLDECCDLLKNKGEVSEHYRAYQIIKETISANRFRFDDDPEVKTERWGTFDEDSQKATIIGNRFDKILTDNGFQPKAFLSWAKKQKLVKTDSKGNAKVQTKLNGINTRCVTISLDFDGSGETFMDTDFDEIPFNG